MIKRSFHFSLVEHHKNFLVMFSKEFVIALGRIETCIRLTGMEEITDWKSVTLPANERYLASVWCLVCVENPLSWVWVD